MVRRWLQRFNPTTIALLLLVARAARTTFAESRLCRGEDCRRLAPHPAGSRRRRPQESVVGFLFHSEFTTHGNHIGPGNVSTASNVSSRRKPVQRERWVNRIL